MSKNKSEFDADHMTIEWNGFGDALGNDLWQFYMSKEYSDVTICTEDGREIKSHRILLAMCSIYLHELFQRHNGSNIVVCLSNVRYDIMKKMLALIYRGIVDIPTSDMQSFIQTAKYLRLQGFEKISANLKVKDISGGTERSGRGKYAIKLKRIQTPTITTNKGCIPEAATDSATKFGSNSDNGTAHSNDNHPNEQVTQEFFPDLSEESDEDETMTSHLNCADETIDETADKDIVVD